MGPSVVQSVGRSVGHLFSWSVGWSVDDLSIGCSVSVFFFLKSKIAHGDVSLFSQLTMYYFFRKVLILSTKYCQIRYLRARASRNRHIACPM